jgi:iron complex transport system substrate-binding protein
MVLPLSYGCVDQHPTTAVAVQATSPDARIIATSPAVVAIAEQLDLDLMGIPQSSIAKTPERYAGATLVGASMAPDLEIIQSLNPSIVLSPISLEADLKPRYEAFNLKHHFVDLRSVDGMYSSIEAIGKLFDRQLQAQELIVDYQKFLAQYQAKTAGLAPPRVLILMGLPGSYVAATPNSYVGSLVKMAGGINVYDGYDDEFLAANTEDMAMRDPDIILRTAHALPDDVMNMFAKEFEANDVWKHFRAVQEDKVYDLPSEWFGMSATFDYPLALEHLQSVLFANASDDDMQGASTLGGTAQGTIAPIITPITQRASA